MEKIKLGAEILGYIVLLATVVVRLTKSKKDDTVVGKVSGLINKLMEMFPTIGVNPATKLLKEEIEREKKIKLGLDKMMAEDAAKEAKK